MPKYRRLALPGHPVFLTLVTDRRRRWLGDEAAVQCLLDSMCWARQRYPFAHLAHVILPDHLHWLVRPSDGTSFSDLVRAVKRDVTWRLKGTGIEGPLWQKRFYDHVIRDRDDLARHLDYVHYNPVKHGYALRPLDYRWSSFAQWLERGVYTEDWGAVEPQRISGMDLE